MRDNESKWQWDERQWVDMAMRRSDFDICKNVQDIMNLTFEIVMVSGWDRNGFWIRREWFLDETRIIVTM